MHALIKLFCKVDNGIFSSPVFLLKTYWRFRSAALYHSALKLCSEPSAVVHRIPASTLSMEYSSIHLYHVITRETHLVVKGWHHKTCTKIGLLYDHNVGPNKNKEKTLMVDFFSPTLGRPPVRPWDNIADPSVAKCLPQKALFNPYGRSSAILKAMFAVNAESEIQGYRLNKALIVFFINHPNPDLHPSTPRKHSKLLMTWNVEALVAKM